jgi:ATP-dependent Clp protease ATP-binding subunit ClpA
MFERFTDRARRTMVLAQEEARTGKTDAITEAHLAVALIVEHEGVAAQVFQSLGITEESARHVLTTLHEPTVAPVGHVPFTPRTKRVLEKALRQALQLGHNYIGTEHLLLGLVRDAEDEPGGEFRALLVAHLVELVQVRRRTIELLRHVDPPPTVTPRPSVQVIQVGQFQRSCDRCRSRFSYTWTDLTDAGAGLSIDCPVCLQTLEHQEAS